MKPRRGKEGKGKRKDWKKEMLWKERETKIKKDWGQEEKEDKESVKKKCCNKGRET